MQFSCCHRKLVAPLHPKLAFCKFFAFANHHSSRTKCNPRDFIILAEKKSHSHRFDVRRGPGVAAQDQVFVQDVIQKDFAIRKPTNVQPAFNAESSRSDTPVDLKSQGLGSALPSMFAKLHVPTRNVALSESQREQIGWIKATNWEVDHRQLCKETGELLVTHGGKRPDRRIQIAEQMAAIHNKSMLLAYVEARKLSEALEIYRRMERLDMATYNILISGLQKDGQVDRAVQILDEMDARGFKPDHRTCNMLLNALEKEDKVDKGFMLFQKFFKYKFCPNSSCLVNLFTKACQLNKVYKVLKLLKGKAKKEAYEMFIYTFCKLGHVREARSLFLKMGRDGHKNYGAIYSNVIQYLCQTNEVDEAWSLKKEMEQHGYQPSTLTCNMIISALQKSDRLDDAWSIFQELKLKGPLPNVMTYNTLMLGLSRAGKQELTLELLNEMQQLDFSPNVTSFNSLIHSFSKLGDLNQVHELLMKMEARGLSPHVTTYNCHIKCFCRMGNSDAAVKVFQKTRVKGFCPTFCDLHQSVLLPSQSR